MAGMSRGILGLDVGSYAVKAVELRQTLRTLEVVQLREAPLGGAGPTLPDRVRELVAVHRLPTQHVVCALPGDRVSSRPIEFPFRDRRRIEQAVAFEVEAQVPFDLEDIVIDWAELESDKTRTSLVATVSPRKEVALLLNTLRQAGVEPRVVEAEGFVLGNLVGLFDLPGRRILLDLGHRKSTLCLLRDGKPLAARSFPVAGRALSEAIAKDLGVEVEEAERFKHEEGIFGARAAQLPAAQAVADRLARELVRSLGSLEPQLGGKPSEHLDGITLLGGTARLHRLDEYLARATGIPTSPLELPQGPAAASLVAGGDPLVFGPAAALALRGTTRATTHMNLRKHELAYKLDLRRVGRELRWTALLAVLAVLLFFAGAITSLRLAVGRAEALEAQVAALYSQAFPGQPVPADPATAMRNAIQQARQRAELLGVYRGNLSALDLLAEVSARVPEDLEVVFEELSIDGKVIRVRGRAPSFQNVDRLKAELAKTPLFARIQTSELQADSRRGGNTFSMTISLAEGEDAEAGPAGGPSDG
jgi:general secretion pathway protein L